MATMFRNGLPLEARGDCKRRLNDDSMFKWVGKNVVFRNLGDLFGGDNSEMTGGTFGW